MKFNRTTASKICCSNGASIRRDLVGIKQAMKRTMELAVDSESKAGSGIVVKLKRSNCNSIHGNTSQPRKIWERIQGVLQISPEVHQVS